MAGIADRFYERFRGLERAHGTYLVGTKKEGKRGKLGGRAQTIKEKATAKHWESHLEGKKGIGIVPIRDDGTCIFGAIDIDVYDLDLSALEKKIVEARFPLVPCQTKSKGAHLYLFFSEPAPAGFVRDRLAEFAVVLGYMSSEIFPKQAELAGDDDCGSWINMPYFGGAETTRYAIRGGEPLPPDAFLDYADEKATTVEAFARIKVPEDPDLESGPPCLQHLAKVGFPEGSRNKALFNLGVYCKKRYGDAWQEKLGELNRKYMKPPLPGTEVEATIKSLSRKEYLYTCKDSPIVEVCNRAMCVRRKFGISGSSTDPGVSLDGLTKILTDPPTWIINVNGKRVRLGEVEILMSQTKFVNVVVEQTNQMQRRIKRESWDDIIGGLLEKVEEVHAPDDASTAGQFLFMMEQFCVDRAPAKEKSDLLRGMPFQEDGFVYFRSSDLLSFMEKRKLRVHPRDAWNYLVKAKAKTSAFKVNGRFVRCWGIPAPAKQDEPFGVPPIEKKEDF